ncbi:hypothetical protein OESDEN_18763, partial [Oesophagostomum dentatum]
MDDVPQDLRELPDGELFLQLQLPDLHVYYLSEVVEMAKQNGLCALIGDGVHKLNPILPGAMEKGQLYTIHAVCNNGFEVPLLFAITRRKDYETYKVIFGRLRELISDENIRIVLDFEKAAIRAVREKFPNAQLQGCAFHL